MFRQCDVTDGSADTLGGLREFKQIFLLISMQLLMKAITQRESDVTYKIMFNIPNTQVHAH